MLKWIARVCEELCVYDKYIDGNKNNLQFNLAISHNYLLYKFSNNIILMINVLQYY